MTVVVTGAAGFIGTRLVNALLRDGHQVVGIDRRWPEAPSGNLHLTADLAAADDLVDDVLAAADVVYHLAGLAGVRQRGPAADAQRDRDNVDATRRVLRAVRPHVPIVVTSSSSVYGGTNGSPCAETDAVRPIGAYARSKVDVERLCAKRVSAGGVIAVARPFTVAGEGQRSDMAIARWIRAAVAGRALTLFGGPDRTRDITDVDDVVEGLRRMGERRVRATINLGTGVPQRLGDIAAAVAAAVGVTLATVIEPADPVDPAATLADVRHCRQLLGFVPRTDLPALVQRQVVHARGLVGHPATAPVTAAALL